MRLLVDTHILLWLAEGSAELSRKSRQTVDRAAGEGGIAISSISFWEVAMLEKRGRIALSTPLSDWRREVLTAPGISEIPLTGDIAIESVILPEGLHDDPADRILVATARLGGLRLGTRDSRLLRYAQGGHVVATKL